MKSKLTPNKTQKETKLTHFKHTIMKTNLLIFSFLIAGIAAHGQNILRVNNIPIVDAPYRTINAALAAAVNDDVILVEGSPTTYTESLTLTKRVKIIGTGYFLAGTNFQSNPYPSTIGGNISFNAGSEGSVVSGFKLGNAYLNVSGITFSNNECGAVSFSASNTTITGNYLFTVGRNYYENTTITNVLITNNYMGGGVSINSDWTYSVVTNNIIEQGNAIHNGQVNNNIFLFPAADAVGDTYNSTYLNNIFVAPSQVSATVASGNVFNATRVNLFVGLPGNNTDTQWKLKSGSAAIGAGVSGVDCGMYGGANPYRPSGILPGQPTITSFTLPGTVPVNGTLNVKVSAKVN
jgi:hypothetical protein